MQLNNQKSPGGKYVCANCIGDSILKEEIRSLNRQRLCSYCNERELAVSIESLADRVDEVYMQVVQFGDEYPTSVPDSDSPIWRNDGVLPSEIVQELTECDTNDIATDLVSVLSEGEAYSVIKDGDTAWYDDTSEIYTIKIPRDPVFRETWDSFKNTVKHSRRFFNEEATALLTEILGPIISGAWPPDQAAVRVIGPTDPARFIFRGRQANDAASQLKIHSSPIRELSAPPRHLNVAGRMNAAGIGAFYGSFDKKTCIAELRSPVGGEAVIGKFELLRPIRILDLTTLESAWASVSYFQPDFLTKYAYGEFVRGFHSEIKKPIIPGRETLEYLPTQFVCEYLWAHAKPRFDGLIYGSSQLSNAANNIVLFSHAMDVEGHHIEVPDSRARLSSFDDEYDLVSFEEPAHERDAAVAIDPNATLRLLLDEIVTINVKAIDYDCEERPVHRLTSRRTPTDFDAAF